MPSTMEVGKANAGPPGAEDSVIDQQMTANTHRKMVLRPRLSTWILPSSAKPQLDGLVLFSVNPATHPPPPPPPPPGKVYFPTFLSEC